MSYQPVFEYPSPVVWCWVLIEELVVTTGGGRQWHGIGGDSNTLTVASSVDASSGCLASDCNALRAVFGIPDNYNNMTTI